MKKGWGSRGFTVIELAVVIFIVALLVTITAVGYRSVQTRAFAANVSTDIQTVETALHAFSASQNRETWINATQFQGTTDANLTQFLNPDYVPSAGQEAIIALRRHLPQGTPTLDGAAITWKYRNNGSVRPTTSCDAVSSGALLVLTGLPVRVLTQLDKEYDDGAQTCGTIRYTAGGELLYQLDFTQRIMN